MTGFPNVLGIIPARKGSKGIPGKNLKLLDGNPLIFYSIKAALQSKLLTTILVSTDCPEIQRYAGGFEKIQVPFLRPACLADDRASSHKVVLHAVEFMRKMGLHFDYVALVQPTSPFRSSSIIDECITHIVRTGGDSLVTVRQLPHFQSPYWALEERDDGFLKFFDDQNVINRRQDLPVSFYRDGQVYISKTTLIYNGRLLGDRIAHIVNEDQFDINIDDAEDWVKADKMMRKWKIEQNTTSSFY